MKCFLKIVLFIFWYIGIPSFVTFMWFNLSIFVPLSEALWSFFNKLTGEMNVGYASDLEFITIYFLGVIVSFALKYLVLTRDYSVNS
ncbi:hypothetical protein B0W48_03335 [Pseudoalteromonas aliena]|uniref:DUF2523 domain-containing protein n=1 Tax=Pseudoalteromonas aliena TaxID=247523 RepID=A0A1Q2GUY3_9GAMM|nr:hypothetical protein B0W48_03335 [Pseudoalteromonas aliena]